MLHPETRKAKVSKLLGNLTDHFNKVTFTEDDWKRWENLDALCADYIKNGKPEFDVIEELGRCLFCRVMNK